MSAGAGAIQPGRGTWARWRSLLLACVLLAPISAWSQQYNNCIVATSNAALGDISSLAIEGVELEVAANSGLTCTGLSLLASSHIKVKVESSTFVLTGPGGQTLPFALLSTSGGSALAVGTEVDFSAFHLLTLFNGPGGSLPMYIRVNGTAGLPAGTYTGSVNLRWYFSVCSGVLGLLCDWSNSPGASSGLLGGLIGWGTGAPVTVNVTLDLLNDCVITAPPLDFGVAPLAGSFGAVMRTISVRCSAGAAYNVGLGDGNHFAGGSRRMRRGASADYLRYEIYRGPASSERWGNQPGEWRSSATADVNAGLHDGTTTQGFTYRAVVDPSQPTPAPGSYTDQVTLQVTF